MYGKIKNVFPASTPFGNYNRTLTFGCIKFYGIFFASNVDEIYFSSCRDSVSLIKYFILD